MTKTVEYIAIGGAVIVVAAITWSFIKPNTQIPVNSNPVQPSGTSFTDILSAAVRGIVAGVGDSERTAANSVSSRQNGTANPIWYGSPNTYGNASGFNSDVGRRSTAY